MVLQPPVSAPRKIQRCDPVRMKGCSAVMVSLSIRGEMGNATRRNLAEETVLAERCRITGARRSGRGGACLHIEVAATRETIQSRRSHATRIRRSNRVLPISSCRSEVDPEADLDSDHPPVTRAPRCDLFRRYRGGSLLSRTGELVR